MNYYSTLKTAKLGELLLVANDAKLTGIYFVGGKGAPAVPKDWKRDSRHPVLKHAGEEIEDYLAGKRKRFSVPIGFDGTKFQQAVWRQIAAIPFGETISYAELAKRAGVPRAVRAAGTATGRNPLGIIIPCHRVVGKNGGLCGFAGGLNRKKRLLEIERSATTAH